MSNEIRVGCLLTQQEYKPGDLPPKGYLAWHEWAEVQRKAGIKQVMCGRCMKWKTPQELSDTVDKSYPFKIKNGEKVVVEFSSPVCRECDETRKRKYNKSLNSRLENPPLSKPVSEAEGE